MDLNGWLTVITVFTAIFALLPKEDLILSFQRIKSLEKWVVIINILFFIPFLIVFPKLNNRLNYLEYFTFNNGFEPQNIAFAMFYICFLWLICRLFFYKPNISINYKIIDYYIELLYEKPFEEFFKLFTKYSSKKEILNKWDVYKVIIFQPKFLNQILEKKPSYILQFWDKFLTEDEFKLIFKLLLENPNSIYYTEIKENWNNYSIMDDKLFLDTVLRKNLAQSINNGIFMILFDHFSKHLQSESGKENIYNQLHYHSKLREEEGFDLPLYYHIQFIGLLYSSAIKNKIDISTVSNSYSNMQGIYSGMISGMVENINITESNINREYPTNYHWLISQIFDIQSNWLIKFCSPEKFNSKSSYVDYFPSSLKNCMKELYDGFEKEKFSQDFLNSKMYYNILSNYFSSQINDEIRKSIELNIISQIPKKHLKSILNFSLDERFAMTFDDLIEENFNNLNNNEEVLLKRLLAFLQNETTFLKHKPASNS